MANDSFFQELNGYIGRGFLPLGWRSSDSLRVRLQGLLGDLNVTCAVPEAMFAP